MCALHECSRYAPPEPATSAQSVTRGKASLSPATEEAMARLLSGVAAQLDARDVASRSARAALDLMVEDATVEAAAAMLDRDAAEVSILYECATCM